MSIKNKTQLKAEVNTAIRVGGQPTKTKATDVRNLLHNVIDSSISTINNIPPDVNGNVTLNVSGTGGAVTVNGIAPDSNGNIILDLSDKVNSVNGILPDADGNVQIVLQNQNQVVSVNGVLPDANGNITLTINNSVVSVNGISPDANGNIILDLNDETKVSSVNGITPDANGNVFLDLNDKSKVSSVNGIRPDGTGNVTLNLNDRTKVSYVNWVATDSNGNVYLDISNKIKSVNGIYPDDEGNITLENGGSSASDIRHHFTVRPREKPSEVFYFESGPVTFRESYFRSQIQYIRYRVRVLKDDRVSDWDDSLNNLDKLNEFGRSLSENSQYEIAIEPEFSDFAFEAGEDVRGLFICSPFFG